MKQNFIFTRRADADLTSIWRYLAERQSEDVAVRVITRIYRECKKLGELPQIGHYRLELLNESHRFWNVWSYLIVYKWQEKPIQIVAVVHGARDLKSVFGKDWS